MNSYSLKKQYWYFRNHKPLTLRLREKGKSNDVFETMLSALTLEELIALKLETTIQSFKGKFFGYPLWTAFPAIAKQALLSAVLNIANSEETACLLLGISSRMLYTINRDYGIYHRMPEKQPYVPKYIMDKPLKTKERLFKEIKRRKKLLEKKKERQNERRQEEQRFN